MLHIPTKDFDQAVKLAAKSVRGRHVIPALETMRVRAGDGITFAGTDLDTRIDVTLPAKSEQITEFLLSDQAKIRKALRAAGGDNVDIKVNDRDVCIKSGDLHLDYEGMPADDWPEGPVMHDTPTFSATLGADAIQMIRRISGAISTEETRYYLNGIYIHKSDGPWGYTAVATDGHRMYMGALELPDAAGDLDGVIIPRRAISILLDLPVKDAPVTMSVGPGVARNKDGSLAPEPGGSEYVRFEADIDGMTVRLTAEVIDGAFPDYNRVVPKDIKSSAHFEAAELRRAVASLNALADHKNNPLKILLDDGEGSVQTSWFNLQGKAETAVTYEGDATDFEVGFNGRYLIDALSAVGGDSVAFGFKDEPVSSPIMIRSPDTDNFKAVLMPMRV